MLLLDFKIDKQFLQSHVMSFSIPANSVKSYHLEEDCMLEYDGEFYYISKKVARRTRNQIYYDIEATALWYRLGERVYNGDFTIDAVSPSYGLDLILMAMESAGLEWQVGNVSVSTLLYSMEAKDSSYLDLLRQWAKICGCELDFDTKRRLIHMKETLGGNYGLSFRYERNLEEIEREVIPPAVTRLYPYGKLDLTIASENGGVEYLEDYSYYTSQGLTLEQAQALYQKDYTVVDESFVDSRSLYQWAVNQIGILAQPIVNYKIRVTDLSHITGYNEGRFGLGDYAVVEDQPLGISVIARVVRHVLHPYRPDLNEIELSTAPVSLPDPKSQTARSESKSWELFVETNVNTLRQIGIGRTVLHRMPLIARSEAEWIIGYSLIATCDSDGTLEITFTREEDDTPIFPTYTIDVVAGQEIRYNYEIASELVELANYSIFVRAEMIGSTGQVTIQPGESQFWVFCRGVVRGSNPSYTNSIRFDYTGDVQSWRVPDDVTEFTFEAYGSRGGGSSPGQGGLGGMVSGKFEAVPGDYFDIYVGGFGGSLAGGGSSQGWPNGGNRGDGGSAGSDGHSGGGSSHMIPAGGSFADAWFVAPAGGGGPGRGGYGGFIAGQDGIFVEGGIGRAGGGATQTTPGTGANIGYDGDIIASVTLHEGDQDGQGFGGRGGDGSSLLGDGGHGGGGGWHGGGGGGGNGTSSGNGRGGAGGGSGYAASNIYDLDYQDGINNDAGYIIISWPDPAILP